MNPRTKSLVAAIGVSLLLLPFKGSCQVGDASRTPPKSMRLCVASGCNTLTFAGDHYDGTVDGQDAVVTKYWIVRWGAEYVEIKGTTVEAVGGGFPAEGVFTGKISEAGTSLENTRDDWHVGPTKGTMPFALTWTIPAPAKPGNGPQGTNNYAEISNSVAALAPPPIDPYPSAPTTAPTGLNGRKIKLDFNGIWEGYYHTPAFPLVIQIKVSSDGKIVATRVVNNTLGRQIFSGQFRTSSASDNGLPAPLTMDSLADTTDGVLKIVDPDHLQVGNHEPFQRVSQPVYEDVPCILGNPMRVADQWAGQRAGQASNAKDYVSTACWLYVAGIQGHADAQMYLAVYYLNGFGVPKDPAAAFKWALVSGQHGSHRGATMVAKMYQQGQGTAVDTAKADYWNKWSVALFEKQKKESEEEAAEDLKQRQGMKLLGQFADKTIEVLGHYMNRNPNCVWEYSYHDAHDNSIHDAQMIGNHCNEDGLLVPN